MHFFPPHDHLAPAHPPWLDPPLPLSGEKKSAKFWAPDPSGPNPSGHHHFSGPTLESPTLRGPSADRPKYRSFLPSPATIFFFLLLLGVLSWNFGGVFFLTHNNGKSVSHQSLLNLTKRTRNTSRRRSSATHAQSTACRWFLSTSCDAGVLSSKFNSDEATAFAAAHPSIAPHQSLQACSARRPEEWNYFSCTGARQLTQELPRLPRQTAANHHRQHHKLGRSCAGPRALGKWPLSSVLPPGAPFHPFELRDVGGVPSACSAHTSVVCECQLRSSSQWQSVHNNL